MTLSEMVTAVREGTLHALRTELRGTVAIPPQIHLFSDGPGPAYAGFVVTRDFEPGEDAAWAIQGLGYPASTLPASRVLIIWEHAYLLSSLSVPDLAKQRALAFLDATTSGYSVTWYPYEAGPDPQGAVRWGKPRTENRPALPGPIIDVLDVWREFLPDDFAETMNDLVQGGYQYRPADDGADPPASAESVHALVEAALAPGEPAVVERAGQALRDALADMPERDPRRGQYLVNLSLVLQLRYENSGDLRDVADAVSAAHEAASYPDLGGTAKRLNALGTALRVWYLQTNDSAALREAITVTGQAADAIPADDLNYGTCLANHAWALHAQFMADEDSVSLDAVIAATRRARAALDVHGSAVNREIAAMQLGVVLHSEYAQTGELAVLKEAIELLRSAIARSALSGWFLAAQLHNLSRALDAWYLRTGELDSLREAIRTERRALAAAPPDHPDRPLYQLNLSEALRSLFDRTGDLAALDEAFTVARDAVANVPAEHPFRINHLANLGVLGLVLYTQAGHVTQLDAAQSLLRKALASAPLTHPLRPAVLAALGEVLDVTSRHTGEFGRLDEAIELTREALDATADGQLGRGEVLRTLAGLYQTRHENLGDQTALPEAIKLLQAATADQTAPVRRRVDAARRWGSIAAAAGLTGLALDGLAAAVELLPQLAARSLHRYDSEYWLSQYAGLASDAAALALAADSPERAVELLELGRAVLIAQALEIRTDRSALRDRDPRLADRFEWFSMRLENDDSEQPDNRRTLADGLAATIAEVRALPGLEGFLRPPKAAELLAQADQGPVIMVNVSEYRCDALVLAGHGLQVRRLPQLSPGALADRVNRFQTALTDCRSQLRAARERGEQTLAETLSWLWDSVCAPVLDTVNPAPGQRIWWIPTGLLGFLPLHAASSQATGESTLSRVVSSYTPSVRTLAHARTTAGGETTGRTLVVGMPHTPDSSDLPGAMRETGLVAERAPDPQRLIGPAATYAAVTGALRDSAWAHFACHAVTAASPSDSQLLLHDHDQRPFTAAVISRLRLESAALAYLSACDTAVTGTDLADEVIHIASTFHIAGYQHVVGTLWAVRDDAAAAIAELVYRELTSGHPDPHRVPTALHNAITRMRESHPDEPSLWASHVHIGI